MKTALVSTTGGTAVCQSKAELAGLIRQGAGYRAITSRVAGYEPPPCFK